MHYTRLALLVAILALAACEKQPSSSADEKIASWDSGFVSKAELDHAMEQFGKVDEKQLGKLRAQALDELVNQKLVYAAAEKQGLTGNPAVVLEEELARRQVVARAYAQNLLANLPKPSGLEVTDYYNRNPQLFSQRRVYQLQELQVKANPAQAEAARAQLGKTKTLGELAGWLKAQSLPATAQTGVKAAEQLPDALREQLAKMDAGQVTVLPTEDGVVILQIGAIQNQALTQEQAAPVIEKILLAEKQKEVIDSDIKKLRDAVKIQYASGFAQTATTRE